MLLHVSTLWGYHQADKLGACYDDTLSTLLTEEEITGLRKTVCGRHVVLPRLAHKVRLVLSSTLTLTTVVSRMLICQK